ncbi:MAG: CTP synthase, partial [Dehalococcoidia bacterium]
DGIRDKISLFCDVPRHAVIPLPTVDNVYEVPLILEDAGLGDTMLESLGLEFRSRDLDHWRKLVDRMKEPKEKVPIVVVGKYTDLPDSYISVKEALFHAALFHSRDIDISWVHSEEIERLGPEELLASACGIVVPGGFGPRGIEGMVQTAKYARENGVPYLGLCLGMQTMVVEYARDVLHLDGANSTEFDPETLHPVIALMPDQQGLIEMGGTMRLGLYPCRLVDNSRAARAYGEAVVLERHRHRYEFINDYLESLAEAGLRPSGISPDGSLVEISELTDHPFMMGVQFHPEFLSRPERPHPLFREFLAVAKEMIREGGQHPLPLNDGQ